MMGTNYDVDKLTDKNVLEYMRLQRMKYRDYLTVKMFVVGRREILSNFSFNKKNTFQNTLYVYIKFQQTGISILSCNRVKDVFLGKVYPSFAVLFVCIIIQEFSGS